MKDPRLANDAQLDEVLIRLFGDLAYGRVGSATLSALAKQREQMLLAFSHLFVQRAPFISVLWIVDATNGHREIIPWYAIELAGEMRSIPPPEVRGGSCDAASSAALAGEWPAFDLRAHDTLARALGIHPSSFDGAFDDSATLLQPAMELLLFPVRQPKRSTAPGTSPPSSDTRDLAAIVQLIFPGPSLRPCVLNCTSTSLIPSIGRLISLRLTRERRHRLDRAVRTFQESIRKVAQPVTPDDVCDIATNVLATCTSAECCAVYVEGRDGVLGLKAATGAVCQPAEAIGQGTLTHALYNAAQTSGDELVRIGNVLDRADVSRHDPGFPIASDADLGGLRGSNAVSWLSLVVKVPDHAGQPASIPLFMVRLLGRRRPGYWGGVFSATDSEIVRRVGQYLGDLLPGLTLRKSIQTLDQSKYNGEEVSLLRGRLQHHERFFAGLLVDAVPSVESCLIVEETTVDGRTSITGRDLNGEVSNDPVAGWRSGGSKRLHGNVYDIPCYEIAGSKTGFRLHLHRSGLPEYEAQIVSHVVSELRLVALADSGVRDKLIQIAEIRHALRAGIGAAIGHIGNIAEAYELALKRHRSNRTDQAVRLIFDQAQFRKSVRRARLAAEQVLALFEDARLLLRSMAKADLQLRNCDVPQLIEETRQIFDSEIDRRGLVFESRIRPDQHVGPATCDRVLMQLCLFNLFDNAIKYSFRASREGTQQRVIVSYSGTRLEWSVVVEDFGLHIPDKNREVIFAPLTRMRPGSGIQSMPGTGLGLAAVKKIVSLHGGRVSVESTLISPPNPLAHTIFAITIPRQQTTSVS